MTSPSNCGIAAGAMPPPAIFDLLHEHGAAWTQIDEPKFRFSIRQDLMPNVKGFYYMRLHGRNAEQWWEHEQSEDRYNYLYSEAELKPIAQAVKTARCAREEAVHLFEQSLRGAGDCRRRGPAPHARRADRSTHARRACRAIRCSRAKSLLIPLHGCSDDAITHLDLEDDVHPRSDLPEHGVAAIQPWRPARASTYN